MQFTSLFLLNVCRLTALMGVDAPINSLYQFRSLTRVCIQAASGFDFLLYSV